MKKLFRPAYLWIGVLLLAIGIMIWKGCQNEPAPQPVNVPTLTPPTSLTSEPTDEELDALKRLQHHKEARPTHETDQ